MEPQDTPSTPPPATPSRAIVLHCPLCKGVLDPGEASPDEDTSTLSITCKHCHETYPLKLALQRPLGDTTSPLQASNPPALDSTSSDSLSHGCTIIFAVAIAGLFIGFASYAASDPAYKPYPGIYKDLVGGWFAGALLSAVIGALTWATLLPPPPRKPKNFIIFTTVAVTTLALIVFAIGNAVSSAGRVVDGFMGGAARIALGALTMDVGNSSPKPEIPWVNTTLACTIPFVLFNLAYLSPLLFFLKDRKRTEPTP